MEEMLCQCVIGHVLSNKQSFVSFAATTKQIYKSFVPELANSLSFFLKAQKTFPGVSVIGSEHFTRPVAKFEEEIYSRGVVRGRAGRVVGIVTHHELARVGPGGAFESLDGDRALGVEPALVDDVGRLVAALGDDVLCGEARGGEAQLLEGELLEWRERVPVPRRLLPICGKFSISTAHSTDG